MQSGTYTVTNVKSGTALDLSAADNRSLIGFPAHGSANQQWELTPLGGGWSIRNVATRLYLTLDQSPGARGGGGEVPVIATAYPISWMVGPIDQEKSVYEISWPHTPLAVDLSNWGDETPGTPVALTGRKDGATCQHWCFVPCASALVLTNDLSTRLTSTVRRTRTELAITLISTETVTEVESEADSKSESYLVAV